MDVNITGFLGFIWAFEDESRNVLCVTDTMSTVCA